VITDWREATEIVVERTKHSPYRRLCSDENPDIDGPNGRDAYRSLMLRLANEQETKYPPIHQQARNLWRDIKAFVRSGGKLAPKPLRTARLSVCESCEKWDKQQRRCTVCGCKGDAKVYSLVAKCPLDKWPKQENIDS
jgi:hypothetical protein